MLKHEDTSQTPPKPAAQVRVTPEELAAAVTALQIRKEGQPGTIAIGDAVEELGLDVTPEEVLAEVQARRIKQRSLVTGSPKRRLRVLLAALLVLVGVSAWGVSQQFSGAPSYDVQTMPTASFVPVVTPALAHLTVDPDTNVADAGGKLRLLWEIGEGQPVHCGFDPQSGTFTQYSPANANNWTLIKHNGRVYVRGRILKMSREVLLHNGADVTAVDNDPQFVVPVTLPLDGFTAASGAGSNVEFHANSVHLDKHAYEKW